MARRLTVSQTEVGLVSTDAPNVRMSVSQVETALVSTDAPNVRLTVSQVEVALLVTPINPAIINNPITI